MGINVYHNKSVIVDHTHQELVDTSLDGNPTENYFNGLRVQYVFRRKTTKGHDRDGNPLVHALKQMNGYHIQPMYKAMLDRRAREILATFVKELAVDAIVDVPSSKPLCRSFAAMVSDVSGIPLVPSDFLRKETIGEMLAEIDRNFPPLAKQSETKALKKELGRLRKIDPETIFQMKEVPRYIRHAFSPFTAEQENPLVGRRVAVVDDIVSSGTSITSMANCLRNQGVIVDHGICLLSDLNAVRAVA